MRKSEVLQQRSRKKRLQYWFIKECVGPAPTSISTIQQKLYQAFHSCVAKNTIEEVMEYWLSKGKELSITLVPIWTKWELVKMIWALRMARLCKINWSCWRFLEAKAWKYTYPSIYPWQATEKRTISLPEKKENIFILSIPLSAREEIGYIKADFFFVWTME